MLLRPPVLAVLQQWELLLCKTLLCCGL